jgi:RNA polymerase sigma-70 factor (ECF subfamily)
MSKATATPERLNELLAAVGRGDERAFAELYQSCSAHLYALLLRILQRRDWAEEALQDCFLKIWQKSETYEAARGAPLTWLLSIARYRALDLLRVKRPEIEMPEEGEEPPLSMADPGEDPLKRAQETEGVGRLADCLAGLQEEQRRCLLLAYYEGYTHQELAQVLRAPLGTVKSWVRRGLSRLRDCLESLSGGLER